MVCRIVLLVSCFFFLIFAPGCQDEFGDSEAEFCILLLKIKFNYWTAVLLCSWPWLFVICHSRRKPWIALLQVLSYLGICTLRMFTSVYGSAMIVDFLAISTQGLFLIGGGGIWGVPVLHCRLILKHFEGEKIQALNGFIKCRQIHVFVYRDEFTFRGLFELCDGCLAA